MVGRVTKRENHAGTLRFHQARQPEDHSSMLKGRSKGTYTYTHVRRYIRPNMLYQPFFGKSITTCGVVASVVINIR